jgi:2-methylcitrate dehydratase PrpD
MASGLPETSVAETLAEKIVALRPGALPAATARKCEDLLIDVVGLCVTARNEDYIRSALAGCDDDGPCTAIGHERTLNAAGAAFVNGTAAHGEDFDDTFEGGPVHAGAVIVPALLAACERHNPDGRMALIGIAVGTEVLCRLSLVVPKAVHKAGFHPTAVFGAMGAAAGAGHIRAALRDGGVVAERQPYLRGGAQEPLTRHDVIDKFRLNAEHGGWSAAQSDTALKVMAGLYNGRIDLVSLRG